MSGASGIGYLCFELQKSHNINIRLLLKINVLHKLLWKEMLLLWFTPWSLSGFFFSISVEVGELKQ
jgi:hypothetical protein